MADVRRLAPALTLDAQGIWVAPTREAISYPPHGNAACLGVEEGSFWFRHRNRCIAAVVRSHPPGGPILDIGGGNGYVALGLAQAGFDVILLEPGPEGALAARTRGVQNVICATLESAGLTPGALAAAGLFDVLEHIEDDVSALRTLREAMAPGGRLYLTVPAYQALFSVDDLTAGHHRRYTASSLGRTVERAGFRVEHATYMFAPLPAPVLLLRTLPSWLGLHKGEDPERTHAEHSAAGLLGRLLDRVLECEYVAIARGHRIPFGGSCLMAARRL